MFTFNRIYRAPIILALLAIFVAIPLSFSNALWADGPEEDPDDGIAWSAGYVDLDDFEELRFQADLILDMLPPSPIGTRGVRAPASPPLVLDEATARKLRQHAAPNVLDWTSQPSPEQTTGYHIQRAVIANVYDADGSAAVPITTRWHVIVNDTGNTDTTYGDADVAMNIDYYYRTYPLHNGEFINHPDGVPIWFNGQARGSSAKRLQAVSYSRVTPTGAAPIPAVLIAWDIPEGQTQSSETAHVRYRLMRRSLTDNDTEWTDVFNGTATRYFDSPTSDEMLSIKWNKIYEYRVIKMFGTVKTFTTASVFVETGPRIRPQAKPEVWMAGVHANTADENVVGDWNAAWYEYAVPKQESGFVDEELTTFFVVYQRANPDLHADTPGVSLTYEPVAITSVGKVTLWGYDSAIDYDFQIEPVSIQRQRGPRGKTVPVHSFRTQSASLAQLAKMHVLVDGEASYITDSPYSWPEHNTYGLSKVGNTYHRVFANISDATSIELDALPRAIGIDITNDVLLRVRAQYFVMNPAKTRVTATLLEGDPPLDGKFPIRLPSTITYLHTGNGIVATDYVQILVEVTSVDGSASRTYAIGIGCWADSPNFQRISSGGDPTRPRPSVLDCDHDNILNFDDPRYLDLIASYQGSEDLSP